MRQHGTPPASSVQGRAGLLRSRQSSHDTSPHRTPALSTPTSAPSAAAIQRALSAASIPQLQQTQQSQSPNSVTDAVTRLTAQKRPIATASGESTPTFAPPSPRLKSPPPVSVRSRRNSALVQNQKPAPPSIVVEPSSTPSEHSVLNDALREEPIQLQPPPGPKAPSRGPSGPRPVLETVVENIAPNGSTSSKGTKAQSDEDGPSTIRAKAKDNNNGEASSKLAESESDANMSDGRGRRTSQSSTIRPKNVAAIKAVYPGLGSKSRASEGTRNMTVETETVSSIPQSQIATIDRSTLGRPDLGGSLRMKPSTETIRPRKERKRATRKAPSINNGTGVFNPPLHLHHRSSVASFSSHRRNMPTSSSEAYPSLDSTDDYEDTRSESSFAHSPRRVSAFRRAALTYVPSHNTNASIRSASSKADIFEARVASAVDEANSSDSDETFVYESNPPEPQHRVSRHHSRTPSGTSLHSQSDFRHGMRPYGDHRIAGKRSMKFSNNPYSVLDSPEAMGDGTVRAHHARHIGRFGRPGGSSRTSLYDQDSPFTQASKLRSTTLSVSERAPSRPGTPRSTQSGQHRPSGLFGKRNDNSQYDFEGEGADDERTPMLGSVRTPRSQRTYGRRYNSDNSMRSIDYYGVREPRSRFSRVGGFILGLLVVMMVTMGAVGLLVMFNKPLTNFHVDKIQNVLASEQEIMLDLLVGAVNPNILSVTVTDMDVNIFAKSKYVNPIGRDDGTVLATAQRRRLVAKGEAGGTPWQDEHGHWHAGSGVDQGTDPIEGDSQTMLLGRILHFDQALCFEGSPLKRHTHYSLGELRLGHPGNKTESGGSERWERVLQYPFELILRGVLRYQLPMSNRHQTAAIGASVIVHPEDPIDSHGRMRLERVDDSEDWQWIEGDDLDGVGGSMTELH
ncbi:hypothetical protein E4T42_08667 [Aureobasidium subglaciale]|nr:hypothetical protein E4T42_08667 [Aureobasidium subglaciale]